MKKLIYVTVFLVLIFAMLSLSAAAEIISEGDQGGNFTWTLTDDGTLTFNTVPYSGTDGKKVYQTTDIWSNNSNTALRTWRTSVPSGYEVTNQSLVTKIVISEGFECIASQHNTNGHKSVLSSWENLETIELPSTLNRLHNRYISTGMFSENPKLKTIYTQGSENNAEGSANIEGIVRFDNGDSLAKLFYNCPLIENIVFTSSLDTGNSGTAFKSNMFSGCTNLKSFEIPAHITEISADMFTDCSSLTALTVSNSAVTLDGLTLPQNEGLVFNVSSTAQYNYVTENYPAATANKISVTGEQIAPLTGLGVYSWELFDGVLTFYRHPDNTSGTEIKTTGTNKGDATNGDLTAFDAWKKTYGASVKHVVISDEFTKISGANAPLVFSNLPNCQTINLGNVTKLYLNWNGTGFFENNKALTSVYGNSVEEKANTADISFIAEMMGSGSNGTVGSYYGGSNEIFRGCESLKKIILPDTKPSTDKKFPDFLPESTFLGCTALEEVVLPSYVTAIGTNSFKDCTSLKSIQIENPELDMSVYASEIPDISGLTIYCSEAQQAAIKEKLVNVSVDYPRYTGEEAGLYSWVLNHEGTLTFYLAPENTSGEIKTAAAGKGDLTCFNEWKPGYAALVKKIVMSDGITYIYGANAPAVLSGYPNVTEINLGDVTGLHTNWSGAGAFHGNSSMTTIYGNPVSRKEGVVDISYIVKYGGSASSYGPNGLFIGCTAMTKVILPTAMPQGDKNAPINYIGSNFFSGCSSLKEIIIPRYVLTVKAKAFNGCTSLERITFTNSATALEITDAANNTSNALPESSTLLVLCNTAAQENAIKSILPSANTANYNPMVCHGFSVRLYGYNGLRSLFGFNTVRNSEIEKLGLTLIEYGALLANKSEYEYWGADLTRVNGKYITKNTSVKKINVFESEKYVMDQDGKSETLDFAASVVNYRNNYTTDVYTGSYAIYEDSEGNSFIAYDYHSEDYKFVNLYDITLGLYKNNHQNILSSKDTDEAAVWNTIMQGADTSVKESPVDGFDGITVTLVKDGEGYISFVKGIGSGIIPSSDAVTAADSITESYAPTKTIALGVNKSESIPENVEAFKYSYLPTEITTAKYSAADYNTAHVQGFCVDDENEYIYFSLTGAILKVRLSDGVEMGKFVVSDELDALGFHAGDLAYHDGRIYTSITYSKSEKSHFGIIDCADLDNGDVSDEVLGAIFIDDINIKLSDGTNAFRCGGIDGITAGKLPGKGYDSNGVKVTDNKDYLIMAICNANNEGSRYDNNNKHLGFIAFDSITEESVQPLTVERVTGEEANALSLDYRMFVYTGYNRYGVQNLAYDRSTGDIFMSCYDREEAADVFPCNGGYSSKCTYVIDGSKAAYYGEIEVGQSASNTEANTNAEPYRTLDLNCDGVENDNLTALTLTLKCICGKGDIDCHDAVAYGDTGYASKICTLNFTSSFGIASLGNGYYYLGDNSNADDDPAAYGGKAYLRRLNRNVGTYEFLVP